MNNIQLSTKKKIKNFNAKKKMLIFLLKIIVIYNAVIVGWDICNISHNSIELSKEIIDFENFTMDKILEELLMPKNILF